nr:MAG TPA: hypothetical protein [Caudoviricetes sp.]
MSCHVSANYDYNDYKETAEKSDKVFEKLKHSRVRFKKNLNEAWFN